MVWAQESVFWSIDDDRGHRGYLLGTIHSEDPRVLDFSESFLSRLNGCDRFAMELVPDLVTLQRLLEFMQMGEGESLEQVLGEVRFNRTVEALGRYGVPREQAQGMKPWAAMLTLSLPPPKTGLIMDFSLSLRAAGQGLEVVGLETLEEQLEFLESLSMVHQIELLDQVLETQHEVQAVHDELVNAYLTGDLAALESMATDQMSDVSEGARAHFMTRGIHDRNQRMTAGTLDLLQKGCVFVAVGALHLPGETGVIAGLEKAGYRLSPLALPFRNASESLSAPANQ